jgi:hypothetical protein
VHCAPVFGDKKGHFLGRPSPSERLLNHLLPKRLVLIQHPAVPCTAQCGVGACSELLRCALRSALCARRSVLLGARCSMRTAECADADAECRCRCPGSRDPPGSHIPSDPGVRDPGCPSDERRRAVGAGARRCFAYIQALLTALSNGQNPLGMSNANANAGAMEYEATARSEVRNTKISPCAARALPRLGNAALIRPKSGKNGHLARANGTTDGPYCSPTWPSVFERRCEPLAGRVGGFGGLVAELHQRPRRPHAARGALLPL